VKQPVTPRGRMYDKHVNVPRERGTIKANCYEIADVKLWEDYEKETRLRENPSVKVKKTTSDLQEEEWEKRKKLITMCIQWKFEMITYATRYDKAARGLMRFDEEELWEKKKETTKRMIIALHRIRRYQYFAETTRECSMFWIMQTETKEYEIVWCMKISKEVIQKPQCHCLKNELTSTIHRELGLAAT
jgi:hypothetical protein